MGTSTDALIYWGFDFHDKDGGEPWHDDREMLEDWEDIYAIRKGIARPAMSFEDDKDAYRAFWKARKVVVERSGCSIDMHQHIDVSVYFVCIKASHLRAWRGHPIQLRPDFFTVDPLWEDRLRTFCELMNIEWQEPKWWLASYWG
jgi:hypothetical protein